MESPEITQNTNTNNPIDHDDPPEEKSHDGPKPFKPRRFLLFSFSSSALSFFFFFKIDKLRCFFL